MGQLRKETYISHDLLLNIIHYKNHGIFKD